MLFVVKLADVDDPLYREVLDDPGLLDLVKNGKLIGEVGEIDASIVHMENASIKRLYVKQDGLYADMEPLDTLNGRALSALLGEGAMASTSPMKRQGNLILFDVSKSEIGKDIPMEKKKVWVVEYANPYEGDFMYYIFDSERKAYLVYEYVALDRSPEKYLNKKELKELYSFCPTEKEAVDHFADLDFKDYGEIDSFESIQDLFEYALDNNLQVISHLGKSVPYDWEKK